MSDDYSKSSNILSDDKKKTFCEHWTLQLKWSVKCNVQSWFNSLWPSNVMWHCRSGSTLFQVMALCNHCWVINRNIFPLNLFWNSKVLIDENAFESVVCKMLEFFTCDAGIISQWWLYLCIDQWVNQFPPIKVSTFWLTVSYRAPNPSSLCLQMPYHLSPLLLTWFDFNPSMDK